MKQCHVKIFITLCALVFCRMESSAQSWCGTRLTEDWKQFILNYNNSQNRRVILPKINRTLNVTVWIVLDKSRTPSHDSAQVVQAVANISKNFADIGLSFVVCKVNFIENWQFNTWDSPNHSGTAQTLYFQPNTINIYFTGDIVTPAGAAGFVNGDGGEEDIIVVKDTAALTHEMGHFFGLPHTFANTGTELVDGSNCLIAGDFICDTEADPDSTGSNVDPLCNYIGPPQRDLNGDFYEPPTDNFMSYYGQCRCRFTNGQYQLMAFTYFNRKYFLW